MKNFTNFPLPQHSKISIYILTLASKTSNYFLRENSMFSPYLQSFLILDSPKKKKNKEGKI